MVNTSLFTGLSGLRSHQRHIDVIGNNLANVSTPGFWSSRATFRDILAFTVRPGSGPSGNLGGQNPMQVGLGVTLGSIDMNTNQGTFQDTGRPLDVAIQGRGFFTLSDGVQNFYTRVGAFSPDADGVLVDARTGYRVVNSAGTRITLPRTDTLPPQATTSLTFQGQLPAEVSGPLQEIVESSAAFQRGYTAQRDATPPAGTTYNLTGLTGKNLKVAVNGSAQQTVQFEASDFANVAAATAAEVAAVFADVPGLETTVNAGTGVVEFTTTKLGDGASLKFDDGTGRGLLAALGLSATLVSGRQEAAVLDTRINDLTARSKVYGAGDRITVSGTNPDGTRVSDTFEFNDADATLRDLLAFLNNTFDGAQSTATLEADGTLRVAATDKGDAQLSVFLGDVQGNTGSSAFPDFKVVQDGEGPDTATVPMRVFDTLGRSHAVTATITRSEDDPNVWDLSAELDDATGTITTNQVSAIRFNPDGSFNVIGGGNNALVFEFDGIGAAQTVTLDMGTSGEFDGVTMLGDKPTVANTAQDGYASGTLVEVAFNTSGELSGFYTNGQSRVLDTLRLTVFPNEAGLQRVGDTMFVESPNSDDAIATTATAAGAGSIRAGSLENSNVDIAEEFVNLITAQRGFQANSRVITTADEILAELVNIIR